MVKNINETRIWEIDLLRCIAILLMVAFHLLYNLAVFYNFPINYEAGAIYYTGKAAASLFILIAGVSCSFSKSNLNRGFKLIILGFLIFIVTSVFLPGSNIIFGILHFMGVSMLLHPLFNKFSRPYLLLVLGTFMIIGHTYISMITMPNNWLAPIGLLSNEFSSADYFPLFPWFGVFLYGIALRKWLYKDKKSLFKFDLSNSFLVLPGRYSLLIYLLHQPVILLILFLILHPR